MKLMSRKFVFASLAIVCISATTCYLKFEGDTYLKLVGSVVGLFMIAQGVVDYKNGGSNGKVV